MAIFCDDCDVDLLLEQAEGWGNAILCSDCLEARSDRLPRSQCGKCGARVISSTLCEKLEGAMLCIPCAHAYELNLFTPPDHVAAQCPICTQEKKAA